MDKGLREKLRRTCYEIPDQTIPNSHFLCADIAHRLVPLYTGKGSIIIVAPTLAGLIVAALAEGKDGILAVLRRMVRWRAPVRWYVIILLFPVLTSLGAVGVHVLFGGTAPQFPLLKQNQHMILLTFIFYLLLWQSSAFLEEVGLRGYAQEESQNKWGPLAGTLILGAFFGAWLLRVFTA